MRMIRLTAKMRAGRNGSDGKAEKAARRDAGAAAAVRRCPRVKGRGPGDSLWPPRSPSAVQLSVTGRRMEHSAESERRRAFSPARPASSQSGIQVHRQGQQQQRAAATRGPSQPASPSQPPLRRQRITAVNAAPPSRSPEASSGNQSRNPPPLTRTFPGPPPMRPTPAESGAGPVITYVQLQSLPQRWDSRSNYCTSEEASSNESNSQKRCNILACFKIMTKIAVHFISHPDVKNYLCHPLYLQKGCGTPSQRNDEHTRIWAAAQVSGHDQ